MQTRRSPAEIQKLLPQIAKEYAAGLPLKVIANHFGFNSGRVLETYLSRHGFHRNRKSKPRVGYVNFCQEFKTHARNGLNFDEIRAEMLPRYPNFRDIIPYSEKILRANFKDRGNCLLFIKGVVLSPLKRHWKNRAHYQPNGMTLVQFYEFSENERIKAAIRDCKKLPSIESMKFEFGIGYERIRKIRAEIERERLRKHENT